MTTIPQSSSRPEGLDQKYVVVKAEDWLSFVNRSGIAHIPATLDPDEFFVIRSQDVNGAAALFGYAHLIQSMLELSRLPGREDVFSDDERTRLLALADRIVEFALTWQVAATKKVPD